MKNNSLKNTLATIVAILLSTTVVCRNVALAQSYTVPGSMVNHTSISGYPYNDSSRNGTGKNGPLLASAFAGKLMLKLDGGYIYSFARTWNKSDTTTGASISTNTSAITDGVGYGASLGYTNESGFGISADYLGFNHNWTSGGTDPANQYNYDASYNVVTFVPNYRIQLDASDYWGLRIGVGVGFSISTINWAKQINASSGVQSGAKIADGAVYGSITDLATLGASFSCLSPTYSYIPSIREYTDSTGGLIQTIFPFNSIEISITNQCLSTAGNSIIKSNITNAMVATSLNNGNMIFRYANINNPVAYGVWSVVFGSDGTATGRTALATATHFEQQVGKVIIADSVWNDLPTFTQNALAAAGALSASQALFASSQAATTGLVKAELGFVIAPQAALEYDNGVLHADVNVKYLHQLLNQDYLGSEGWINGQATSTAITYTSKAGPFALFVGVGMGINF
ncbi:MAG: hypothetical protein QM529_06075 [Hydrotalea sp.]|nr:hypothetical protein [Hydrotalea sp.]